MSLLNFIKNLKPQEIFSSSQLASLIKKELYSQNQNESVLTPDLVLDIISYLSFNDDLSQQWNPDFTGKCFAELVPQLNWDLLLQKFKQTNTQVSRESDVLFFIKAWLAGVSARNGNIKARFPFGEMCEGWADQLPRLNFIKTVVESDSISSLGLDRGMDVLLPGVDETLHVVHSNSISRMIASPWNSLNLLLSLTQMLETNLRDQAQSLLEYGNNKEPVLVTLGLIRLKVQHPQQQSIIYKNSTRFLQRKHIDSLLFCELLRIMDRGMFISVLCSLYRRSPRLLKSTLDALVAVNMLHELLLQPRPEELSMLDFVLELAVLASRREYLSFEVWFVAMLGELGTNLIHPALEVVQGKLQKESARQRGETLDMRDIWILEEFEIFFSTLSHVAISANNTANLKALYIQYMSLLPELKVFSEADSKITDETIEKDAERLFLQLYRGDLSLEKILDVLGDLRDSPQKYQRRTYAYAVQYPIDEYKFFANYPEKELSITAYLVGQLVRRHMYSPSSEDAVIDLIKSAISSGSPTKAFQFGIVAVQQFVERLESWPAFCILISQIPEIKTASEELSNLVDKVISSNVHLNEKSPETETQSAYANKYLGNERRGLSDKFTAVDFSDIIDPSFLHSQIEPPESVRDKVQFVMNNLSGTNLEAKSDEINKVLELKHLSWISNILIKRAGLEPNYHEIYLKLIDLLELKIVHKFLLRETLIAIYSLLNAESTVTSSRDRSQLGNLGSWLGGMTLLRNKPLIRSYISLKALLIQGYESERLIVAIPFVCKVLKQCANSKVFKPPNPWLMRILYILVELYTTAELKLNLKFEIEVLCRSLGLEIKNIPPSQIIRDHVSRTVDALAHDLGSTRISDGRQSAVDSRGNIQTNAIPILTSQDLKIDVASALVQHAQFTATASLFHTLPGFKKLFYALTENIITETIPNHISRAVFIAVSATKDTVQRDFCGEPNEERMHRAAQLMVRGIGGALAVSFCREQLKSKMYLGLRERLLAESFSENTANQLAAGLVGENLDLACAIAEKEAIERASLQIDQIFNEAFQARKRMRERTGQPYYDIATHSALIYPADCPDSLRVKLASVPPALLRVYDDFTQIPHFPSQINSLNPSNALNIANISESPSIAKADALALSNPASSILLGNDQPQTTEPARPLSSGALQQLLNDFSVLMAELGKYVSIAAPGASLSTLPQTNAIRVYAKEILVIISKLGSRESSIVEITQSLIKQLLTTETRIGLELYTLLLLRVCQIFPVLSREVSRWLTYSDNEIRFNVPVTLSLLHEGLVNPSQYDAQLAKLIDSRNISAIKFSVQLVRKAVIEQSVPALPQDFSATIESLYQIYLKHHDSGDSGSISKQNMNQIIGLIKDFKQYRNSSNEIFDESSKDFLDTGVIGDAIVKKILSIWAWVSNADNIEDSDYESLINQTYGLMSISDGDSFTSEDYVTKVSYLFQKAVEIAIASYENGLSRLSQVNAENGSPHSLPSAPDSSKAASSAQALSSLSIGRASNASKNLSETQPPQSGQENSETSAIGQPQAQTAQTSDIIPVSTMGKHSQASQALPNKNGDSLAEDIDATNSSTQLYQTIDSVAKLIGLMIRTSSQKISESSRLEARDKNSIDSVDSSASKPSVRGSLSALDSFLTTYVLLLVKDHFGPHFATKQKPYFRLLSMVINEIDSASVNPYKDFVIDKSLHLEALKLIAKYLLKISPTFVSGFSFAWLSLIMDQRFLPKLLEDYSTWGVVESLLVAQLESLEPFVEKGVATDSLCLLYRGTVRVLLVILHDYPNFLAEHAFALCNVVPITCIQTRNLLLSAFETGMVLPEPLTPNLNIDLLEASKVSPKIGSDYLSIVKKARFYSDLESFIASGKLENLSTEISEQLLALEDIETEMDLCAMRLDGKSKYDIKLINALVLHLIVSASGGVIVPENRVIEPSSISEQTKVNINILIKGLLLDLSFEGKYLLLSSLSNHLRFPSTHTTFVSHLFYSLFEDKSSDLLGIKEVITRVLIERITVNHPFPWGLLVTIHEIIINPKYEFWSQPYTRCLAQIEEILTVVTRNINPAGINDSKAGGSNVTDTQATLKGDATSSAGTEGGLGTGYSSVMTEPISSPGSAKVN